MPVVLAGLGALMVVVTFLDAIWTTLGSSSGGGPLTRRVSSGLWRMLVRLRPDGGSRLLEVGGPAVLLSTVLVWVVLLWTGWTLVFSSTEGAVRASTTADPVDLPGRVYFAGFVIFTLGVGDLVPGRGLWQVVTAVATFLGLFLVTLSITYLVSVVSASVSRRRLAQTVSGLGASGSQVVLLHWNGDALDGQLASQIRSVANDLLGTTQQHLAYPVLHAFHATVPTASAPRAVAVLDDVYVVLAHGLDASVRPTPAVLEPLRAALADYASTVQSMGMAGPTDPPSPSLAGLRAAGVPVVEDGAFATALSQHAQRRRQVHQLVRGDAWSWPDGR